MKAAKPVTIT